MSEDVREWLRRMKHVLERDYQGGHGEDMVRAVKELEATLTREAALRAEVARREDVIAWEIGNVQKLMRRLEAADRLAVQAENYMMLGGGRRSLREALVAFRATAQEAE